MRIVWILGPKGLKDSQLTVSSSGLSDRFTPTFPRSFFRNYVNPSWFITFLTMARLHWLEHWVVSHERSRVRIPCKPEFFRFSFCNCIGCAPTNAKILFTFNFSSRISGVGYSHIHYFTLYSLSKGKQQLIWIFHGRCSKRRAFSKIIKFSL